MHLNHISARPREERGATMMVFSILLAFGVSMGMLAISVDVGAMMLERRQLQNGADATSLALADVCARGEADCNPATNTPVLKPLLNLNSGRDAKSQFDPARGTNGQCGRVPGEPAMPGCPTTGDITDLRECTPLPSWLTTGDGVNIPYVETYSLTESNESDPSLLPRYFSQLLAGGGSDVSVTACARAAWGAPKSFAATVPVTFSTCEWQRATSNGADYVEDGPMGPWPGYGGAGQPAWPDASKEVVIQLQDPSAEDADCAWNGKDTSGGFGYIREADGTGCSALVSTDGWTRIDTGNSVSPDCTTGFGGMRGTTINIPVFDCMLRSHSQPTGDIPVGTDCDPATNESGGANTYYHIVGWAKFYLSGYKISGTGQPSVRSGSVPCSGGDRCLSGWFLQGSLQNVSEIQAPVPGDTDFGTYAVLPAG